MLMWQRKLCFLVSFTLAGLWLNTATAAESRTTMNNSIVHLGGYADVGFMDSDTAPGTYSIGRFSPIFHYLYSDIMLVEVELEIEMDESTTVVKMEYLTLDLFLCDYATLVVGKFLSPLGFFRQNLHPSWVNKSPIAPVGFGHGGAAPIADIGLQFRGGFLAGPVKVNYGLYSANGPKLELEQGSTTELEIHREGSNGDNDENKAMGGRIGIEPMGGLEVGISLGSADAKYDDEEARAVSTQGFDLYFRPMALNKLVFRAEYIKTTLAEGNVTATDVEQKDLAAWYAQLSYRIGRIEPVVRIANYTKIIGDADAVKDDETSVGLNYLFASNVIAKLAYLTNKNSSTNETVKTYYFQVAFGF